MINSTVERDEEELARAIDEIVERGPHGAIALAALSTACVIGIWLAFYFLVFSPRAPLP